jgi:hypothetical protein
MDMIYNDQPSISKRLPMVGRRRRKSGDRIARDTFHAQQDMTKDRSTKQKGSMDNKEQHTGAKEDRITHLNQDPCRTQKK